jgi:uncharacterized membrane protein
MPDELAWFKWEAYTDLFVIPTIGFDLLYA